MENMILKQNITMTKFAFPFKEKGIYVFENYSSRKVTVIAVVGSDETCTNSINGVGAAMITEQALSEIGIKSQKKNVDPDWSYITLVYFMLLLFIFGVIGIIVLGQNLSQNTVSLAGGKKKKINTIYYDRLNGPQDAEGGWTYKCRKCLRKNKVDKEEEEPEPEVKKHDLNFGYD